MPGFVKTCKKCGVEKSLEFFRFSKGYYRGECKECNSLERKKRWRENPEKAREAFRKWCQKNPEKSKKRWEKWKKANPEKFRLAKQRDYQKHYRRREYGLSSEDYESMLRLQDNACACCGDVFVKTPRVDHLHGSDPCLVRGLLCHDCNIGLGCFKDSPERLQKAAVYLKKFLP